MLQFHPWHQNLQYPVQAKPLPKHSNQFENLIFGILELGGVIILGAITGSAFDWVAGLVLATDEAGEIGLSSATASVLANSIRSGVYHGLRSGIQFGTYLAYNAGIQKATTGTVSNPFSSKNWETTLLTASLFLLPVGLGYVRKMIKTGTSFFEYTKKAVDLYDISLEEKAEILKQAQQVQEELLKINELNETEKWNLRYLRGHKYEKISNFFKTLDKRVKGRKNGWLNWTAKSKFYNEDYADEKFTKRFFRVDKNNKMYLHSNWAHLIRKADSILMRISPTYAFKLLIRTIFKVIRKTNVWKVIRETKAYSGIRNFLRSVSQKATLNYWRNRFLKNLKTTRINGDGTVQVRITIGEKKYIWRDLTKSEKFQFHLFKRGQQYYKKRFGIYLQNPIRPALYKNNRQRTLHNYGEWIEGIKITFKNYPFLSQIGDVSELLSTIDSANIEVGKCDVMFIFDIVQTSSRNNPGGKPPIIQRNVNFEGYIKNFITAKDGWSNYYYHYIMWGKLFSKIFQGEGELGFLLANQVGHIISELRWIIFDAVGIVDLVSKAQHHTALKGFSDWRTYPEDVVWGITKNTSLKFYAPIFGSLAGGKITGRGSALLTAQRRLRTRRKYKIRRPLKYTKRY